LLKLTTGVKKKQLPSWFRKMQGCRPESGTERGRIDLEKRRKRKQLENPEPRSAFRKRALGNRVAWTRRGGVVLKRGKKGQEGGGTRRR